MKKLTKHHIIPKSRGGSGLEYNLSFIPDRIHKKYHSLFENKTPPEIVEYLVDTFWRGNDDGIIKYLYKNYGGINDEER